MVYTAPYIKYMDIKYNLYGNSVRDGFNCWTFARYYLKQEYDLNINDYIEFELDNIITSSVIHTTRAIKTHCENQTKIVRTYDPADGDICFMGCGSRLTHIGVITSNGVVHCHRGHSGIGMVIFTPFERLNSLFSKSEFYTWRQ